MAEFLGKPVSSVLAWRKRIFDHKLHEARWNSKPRNTEDEILEYYCSQDYYLYMYCFGPGVRSELLAPIIRLTEGKGTVLDYGCGVAAEAYWLARSGAYEVGLADLQAPHFRFAQWRFRKYRLCESFYVLPKDREALLARRFNAIMCFEVIEHVVDWRGTLDHLMAILDVGGWLLMTIGPPSPTNTLHLNDLSGLTRQAYETHLTHRGLQLIHTDSPKAEFWVWRKPA